MHATLKLAVCFGRWRKLLIFSATCHSKRQAEQFTDYYTDKLFSWTTVYYCLNIVHYISRIVLKLKQYFVFSWKTENHLPSWYACHFFITSFLHIIFWLLKVRDYRGWMDGCLVLVYLNNHMFQNVKKNQNVYSVHTPLILEDLPFRNLDL